MRVLPGIVVGCVPVLTCLLHASLAAQAHWSPEVGFASRYYSAGAFDAARSETVLFGGDDGSIRDDTWVWDGSAWSQRTPANVPPPRLGHHMVYDSVRQRVVMFHGSNDNGPQNDMWAWDGTDWSQLGSSAAVPHYGSVAVTYDAARDRIVLWGGNQSVGHLWEFDGTSWAEVPFAQPWPPLQGPPPLAFDADTDTVALYTPTLQIGLWRWDGSSWSNEAAGASTFSSSSRMVHDPVGHRLLLVGGYSGAGTLLTWVAAVHAWQVLATGGPIAQAHVAVMDSARGRVVAVGALGQDQQIDSSVWESDGGAWQQVATAAPCARGGATMAHDDVHGRLYLFGGAGSSLFGDLWMREAGQWRLLVPQVSQTWPGPNHPGRISGAQLVYDEARDELLLVGGYNGQFPFYRLSGSQWQRIDVPNPGERSGPGVVYDRERSRVVLFGGVIGFGSNYGNDTWTWDGSTWQQLPTANAPPPRGKVAMAYDPVRDRVVLVGGVLSSGAVRNTWELDGQQWSMVDPFAPIVLGQQAAYDRQRQAVVATTYGSTQAQFETWQWFGDVWQRIALGDDAPMHVDGTLLDTDDGVLLFGGRAPVGDYLSTSLRLRGAQLAEVAAFGVSGASSAGDLHLLGEGYLPWIGSGFRVRLQPLPAWPLGGLWLGLSRTEWLGLALPLDLAAIGNPGNFLNVSLDGTWPLLDLLDGTAVATITIPATTALIGAEVFAQGFVFEPLTGALTTSNALAMTFGAR